MDVESMLEAPLAEKKGQDFLNSLDLEKEVSSRCLQAL